MIHPADIAAGLAGKFPVRIKTIDSHTAGEPTRLIVDGIGSLPGRSLTAKRDYFRRHLDHLRLALTREPRGHRDLLAALLTEAVSPQSDFGLIFMDARRYPYLCGHATIGAVATLVKSGALEPVGPEFRITVDTPSGPVNTRAIIEDGRLEGVAACTVPSFVYRTDQPLEVPGYGRFRVDTVCVGGFFAMVSADQINIPLDARHAHRLIRLGMAIIEAANHQLEVRHPRRPEVRTVDVVEFFDVADPELKKGQSVVIYGEAHMDRSPCGTGTAAKLTLLHHRGELAPHQAFVNAGPLGTTFEARIVAETTIGRQPAVEVEILGSAHITGVQEFLIETADPFPEGYLI